MKRQKAIRELAAELFAAENKDPTLSLELTFNERSGASKPASAVSEDVRKYYYEKAESQWATETGSV